MPDQYGNITGRDFLDLAGMATQVTKNRALHSGIRRQKEADVGYGLASKGNKLPEGASVATGRGFNLGLQETAQRDRTQIALDVDKRFGGMLAERGNKEAVIAPENINQQGADTLQKVEQRVAGLKKEQIGEGLRENDPEGSLKKETILQLGEATKAGKTPSPQDNAKRLATFGTNAKIEALANQKLAQFDFENEKTAADLFKLKGDKANQDYEDLKKFSRAIKEAESAGNKKLAAELSARAGNLSWLQDRFSPKGDKVLAEFFMAGESKTKKEYTPSDVTNMIDGLIREEYITQSNASVVANAQMPTITKYFKDKDGKVVEAISDPSLDSNAMSWGFFNPDGSQLAAGKDGNFLTRIQDAGKWGLKPYTLPTKSETLARDKYNAEQNQQIITNKNKDIKIISDMFLKLKEDSTKFGTPFDDVATTKRAFEMAGYPEANINQKTGEILYRDKYTNGYVNAQLMPVEFGKPKKKTKPPPPKTDADDKKIKGFKKPPPKDLESLSKIANKGIATLTPYKDKERTSAGLELLRKVGGAAKRVGKAISTPAKETELMVAIGKSGLPGGLAERAKMAKNLRRKYVNYTEKELIEMINGLKGK